MVSYAWGGGQLKSLGGICPPVPPGLNPAFQATLTLQVAGHHEWCLKSHSHFSGPSILLFKDGRLLKLCDFGTARKLQHTLTNAVGTVLYMAPEVIKS